LPEEIVIVQELGVGGSEVEIFNERGYVEHGWRIEMICANTRVMLPRKLIRRVRVGWKAGMPVSKNVSQGSLPTKQATGLILNRSGSRQDKLPGEYPVSPNPSSEIKSES
jgi:hypothetical protein